MIENFDQLATAIGCRSANLETRHKDITNVVGDHTNGFVRVVFRATGVELTSRNGVPVDDWISYPFLEDDFWKAIEWVHEEIEEYDEEDGEYGYFTSPRMLQNQPHEFYD